METFPSPKTASPTVYSLLESQNHLSPVSWSLRLLHYSSQGTGHFVLVTWSLMQLGCCSRRVLIAFSVLFLYKGLYVWEYSPWSYLNIYSLAPCCLIALNMLLLGCCFQLLHFLVSVLCSCSSVILPHTNIATSVTERGLGSLSEDLAEVRHELQLSINKRQIAVLSPCKYSL